MFNKCNASERLEQALLSKSVMPRIARGLVDGFAYHVINRGNWRQRVFHTPADYRSFISLILEAKKRYSISVFSYCLMPNHFHMLVLADRAVDLSKWMHWLLTAHVRRTYRLRGTDGHIWQGRFRSFIIKGDGHLLTVARYIEANPVRGCLVESAENWPWSSHRESIGQNGLSVIDRLPIELPSNWARMVNAPLEDNDLETVRLSVNRQRPYGDEAWQNKVCLHLNLQSTIRPVGRPRKDT
jgi:putative transposase